MKIRIKRFMQKVVVCGLSVAMMVTMIPISSVKAQAGELHHDINVMEEWTEEDLAAFGNGTLSLSDQVAFMDSMSNVSVMSVMRVANALGAEAGAIPATTIGGESNPFKIGNATILQELATLVNNGATYGNNYSYGDAYYEMVADIDMDDIGWTTISNFTGSFNGNSYEITTSVIKTATGENGLFAMGTENVRDVTICYTGVATPSGSWSDYRTTPYRTIEHVGGELIGYYIDTAEQLAWVANSVNNGEDPYNGYTYLLSNDIDLSAHEWVPIGTQENPFKGAFYGADYGEENHTISGLYIESTEDYQGLFGYVSNTGSFADVEDMKHGIHNVDVEGSVTGGDYTGGIVGYNDADPKKYGYIDNCSFSGRVQGENCTGGIVGKNYSSEGTVTVQTCSNTSIVVGGNYVGGVVGFNGTVVNDTAIVDECSNSGNVSGVAYVGGVVGISSPGQTGTTEVKNCSATCTLVIGDSNVGRVVGYNEVTDENLTATLNNNQAYAQMKIGASGSEAVPTENIGGGQINGADMDEGSFTPADNLWTSYAATGFTSTEGGSSETSAIVITTAEELAYLAKSVNEGTDYTNTYFKLGNNIDLSAHEWVAIGTEVDDNMRAFSGTFNGDGHTISGMTIETNCKVNEAHYYVGLFGYVKNATLENLNVSGTINVTANDTYGTAYVGGLVGYVRETSSKVDKCGTNVTITVSDASHIMFEGVGGLVGQSFGEISKCYATGNISVEESNDINVGGLVGQSFGEISNCYATGNISVDESDSINGGGLVGQSWREISNCYATGNISNSGKYNIYAGGIVGNINGSKIDNCVSLSNTIASISTNGKEAAGGRVVAHDGTVSTPSEMLGLYAWSGTTGGGDNKTTSGLDGADLYYSSGDGFTVDNGLDFGWSTICPSEAGWTIPTGDNAKYQLPSLTGVSKEIPQNPLANIEFVTVTFDYAEEGTTDKEVVIEIGGALGSSNIPEGIWGTVDETTGAITEMDGDIVFYKDTTITELVPEASVTSEDNTINYATLEQAISAANTSESTVTLLKEVKIDTTLTISGTVTLNLSGYALTYTGEDNVITITGTLTMEDDAEIAGTITGNVVVGTSGTLIMASGTIDGTVDMQGTMKVSGNPEITTVSVASGKKITVTSALTEGASIGISTASEATDGNPVDLVTGDNLDSSYFTLDSSKSGTLQLTTDKTKIQLVAPHTHTWVYNQGTKEDPENPGGTIADESKIVATCNTGACSGNSTTAELTISASDGVYTGTTYEGVIITDDETNAIKGDETIQYRGIGTTSYGTSTTAPTNVGSYEAFLKLGEITAKASFEITPAPMPDTIIATDYDGTYDGEAHGITVSGYPDGATVQYGTTEDACNQDSITYSNVTTGTRVYYKVSMDNYQDVTGSASVIITKAPLTVKVKDGQSITKIYDGTVAVSDDVLLEVEGLQKGETATASGTCTYASTNVADDITINITNISIDYTGENTADEANYSYTATNLTTTGNITEANSTGSATYTGDGDIITYGDTVTIQYTPEMVITNRLMMRAITDDAASKTVELWYGDQQIALETTLNDIEQGETANIVFPVNKANFPDGSQFDGTTNRIFTIKWGGDGNLNPSTTTLNLKLGQKIIDDVRVDETKGEYTSAYTGLAQDFDDVALTSFDVVTGDAVGLTVDYTTTQANVADYNVSGIVVKSSTDTDAGYYVLDDKIVFSGTVSITQKDVSETEKAQLASIIEGNVSFTEPTFDGVNDEDVTGSIKYTYDSAEYTSYDALITALDDVIVTNSGDTISVGYEFTANGNYTGTISGDITMTVLKVVFDGNVTMNEATYGDTWDDILEFTQETYKATVGGEEVAGTYTLKIEENTYSGTAIPKTGDYDWVVTFTSSNGIYENLNVESDTVRVNPLTATYTWDQTSFEYDGTEKLPIPTMTNKVGADDVKVTATGAQTDASTGYTATAVLEGADASNYALPTANANATFEITPIKATGTIAMTVSDNGDTPLKAQDTITIAYNNDTLSGTPTYQWYDENDAEIVGENNASYTIPEGITSGSYYCVVTLDGNTEGSFTSEKIQVGTTKPTVTKFIVTPGNSSATLNWSLEESNSKIIEHSLEVTYIKETTTIDETTGLSTVTRTEESVSGSPFTIAAGATSYTVTGLTNGTNYTFKLTAINVMGSGMSGEISTTPCLPASTGGSTPNPTVTLPPVQEEIIIPEEVPEILEQKEETVTQIEKEEEIVPPTTDSVQPDTEETTGEDIYIYQEFDTTLGSVVGEDIHKNARIIITRLEQEEELSTEHKNAVETFEEMCEILKNYEVTIVDGDFIGELHITFQVGEEYNGETVTIVHLTEEGYESFVRMVKEGEVDVVVSSLSPFIILRGEVDVAQLFQTPIDDDKPAVLEEVTNAGMNFIPIIAILLIILFSVFFFLLYKKRKNEDEE